MKILVTGLCISRNLGGPAMALSLMYELQKIYNQSLDFAFAVSAADFEMESIWAKKYGLNVIKASSLTSYVLNKYYIKNIYQFISGRYKFEKYQKQKPRNFYLEAHDNFLEAIRQSDIVINMSGISYIGDDGIPNYLIHSLNCYSDIYYCKKNKVKFCRFIQSFGPFIDPKVRFFAKKEFDQLPFVPARGKNCAAMCRSITKTKVYDFPDIAILLPLDKEYAENFLLNNNLQKNEYIVISPSAVIKNTLNKNAKGSVGKKHIESFVFICQDLIDNNHKLLFVPHMYSDVKCDCDREICLEIISKIKSNNIFLVEDNFSPMQAKALISFSKFAIVSRYHALVAALSTYTPVITIGWNIKYQDLMEYYDMEEYSVDARDYEPEELSKKVLGKIDSIQKEYDALKEKLGILHKIASIKVNNSFKLLSRWIDND